MADEVSLKQSKKDRKRSSNSQDEEQNRDDVLMNSLQTITKYLGIGGLYSSKKRKVETHKNSLSVLSEDWFNLDTIKKLSTTEKERYADEITPITIQILTMLRNMMKFYHKCHSKDSKRIKDVMTDSLLKDIKTNHSLPLLERHYCDIGLWKKVMEVNQQVWRSMQQLDDQERQETMATTHDESPLDDQELEESDVVADVKENKSFRDFYMEMVTTEFADDLDKIRKDSNLDSKQISILIDCLETGKDIWTALEKQLLQSLSI